MGDIVVYLWYYAFLVFIVESSIAKKYPFDGYRDLASTHKDYEYIRSKDPNALYNISLYCIESDPLRYNDPLDIVCAPIFASYLRYVRTHRQGKNFHSELQNLPTKSIKNMLIGYKANSPLCAEILPYLHVSVVNKLFRFLMKKIGYELHVAYTCPSGHSLAGVSIFEHLQNDEPLKNTLILLIAKSIIGRKGPIERIALAKELYKGKLRDGMFSVQASKNLRADLPMLLNIQNYSLFGGSSEYRQEVLFQSFASSLQFLTVRLEKDRLFCRQNSFLDGNNLAHYAVMGRYLQVLEYLAESDECKGIFNDTNFNGDTPLSLAIRESKHLSKMSNAINNSAYLSLFRIINLMMRSFANLTVSNKDGHDVFQIAILLDNILILDQLISQAKLNDNKTMWYFFFGAKNRCVKSTLYFVARLNSETEFLKWVKEWNTKALGDLFVKGSLIKMFPHESLQIAHKNIFEYYGVFLKKEVPSKDLNMQALPSATDFAARIISLYTHNHMEEMLWHLLFIRTINYTQLPYYLLVMDFPVKTVRQREAIMTVWHTYIAKYHSINEKTAINYQSHNTLSLLLGNSVLQYKNRKEHPTRYSPSAYIEAGYDVNYTGFNGLSPISRAMYNYDISGIKTLIRNGALCNQYYGGQSLLEFAIATKQINLIQMVLECGAHPDLYNYKEVSMFYFFLQNIKNDNRGLLQHFIAPDSTGILVSDEATGMMMFQYAITRSTTHNPIVLSLLLNRKYYRLFLRNEKSKILLQAIDSYDVKQMTRFLEDYSSIHYDLKSINSRGETAFHAALIKYGRLGWDIYPKLLGSHDCLNKRNNNGVSFLPALIEARESSSLPFERFIPFFKRIIQNGFDLKQLFFFETNFSSILVYILRLTKENAFPYIKFLIDEGANAYQSFLRRGDIAFHAATMSKKIAKNVFLPLINENLYSLKHQDEHGNTVLMNLLLHGSAQWDVILSHKNQQWDANLYGEGNKTALHFLIDSPLCKDVKKKIFMYLQKQKLDVEMATYKGGNILMYLITRWSDANEALYNIIFPLFKRIPPEVNSEILLSFTKEFCKRSTTDIEIDAHDYGSLPVINCQNAIKAILRNAPHQYQPKLKSLIKEAL